MKIIKFMGFSVAVIATLLSTTYSLTAQAYSYNVDSPIPTFGLYCEEDGIIKNGTVKFDLTDSEMFSNKKAMKEAEYIVSGNRIVTLEIPFLSSYLDIPQFNVTVNGQAVEGKVWYGDNEVRYGGSNSYLNALSTDNSVIEEKLEMTYSPILDETVVGTLYTLTPDADIMTVTLKIEQSCSYVYDGNNRRTESNSPDGTQTWIYENALSQPSYQYFFVGENIDFTSTCEFQTEAITFKDFIDRIYTDSQEYYETVGVQTECLYANANRVLQNKSGMLFSEFFYNSISRVGLNSYKFTVRLNGETTIKYSSEVVIQADYRYEPTVYLVGQKQIGSYPTNYYISLNSEIQYIVQSSTDIKKSKMTYTASSTDNFYFICCSVSWKSGLTTAQLAISIVGGIIVGIALIFVVVNTVLIIREKKRLR